MMSDLNKFEDSELIKQSQQGDVRAFNVLIERYQPEALNVAYRMLGNRNDAEDACQEAWLSAWKSIRQFRGEHFKAWVLAILANACRHQFRKRKQRLEITIPDFPPHTRSDSGADDALINEKIEAVQKALLKLPHEQRLVITLRAFSGLSYEEIARVMNCSVGTVKSRLNRAKISLRDMLQDEELT